MLLGGSCVICMMSGMFPGLDLYYIPGIRMLHIISQQSVRIYLVDDKDRDLSVRGV